ncbi:MAG: hypothetical protein NXI27_30425, partial [Alphaproteobacteria bacterium]|nr:hypothetical protein [Alphaproteobacteria bacterium]
AALHDAGNRRRRLRHYNHGSGENRRPVTTAEPRPKSKVTPAPGTLPKSVTRSTTRDPVLARRDKLVTALKEQQLVHAGVLKGEDHLIERHKWMNNEQGERVLVKTNRRVRPWFFEQDGGWYVQSRYGARVIAADGRNNAVFVKSLKDVGAVLEAFIAATQGGELDAAMAQAAERKPRTKPGAAKAAANA